MKKFFLLFSSFTFLSIGNVFGQINPWKPLGNVKFNESEKIEVINTPKQYNLFNLNNYGLANELASINDTHQEKVINFPNSKGELVKYRIKERSTFTKELQAKFPSLRSYAGKSLDGKSNIRFSYSSIHGLSAMIFHSNHSIEYIDAYTKDLSNYIAYNRKNIENSNEEFICKAISQETNLPQPSRNRSANRSQYIQDGVLRTYRLALASTFEYSRYHYNRAGLTNGTDQQKKEAVLSAMNVAMTRVNGIYETELGITMVLIPNNDQIIYITSNDPFTNNDGDMLLNENQLNTDAIIGPENYDIGHIFSTGGGGVAWLGSPCMEGYEFYNGKEHGKASGVTGLPAPINDAFYVDYVAHEMGHQFGANHTFNNSCGFQRNAITAMEPGSGSTIMAYAGICAPNVQNNSDPYFHSISLAEIYDFINTEGTCSVNTTTGNHAPIVTVPNTLFLIPHSTAFKLEGQGTDQDNDQLTYNWEQTNQQVVTQPPVSTNAAGPTFRSLPPVEVPYRYFPNLTSILNNQLVFTSNPQPYVWEVIPSVGRNISFSLVVRDNNINGGQTAVTTVVVRTIATAGPFQVTSQTTNETWVAGQSATITWDVAGTDANGINTENVKILISKDGGLTWDYTLVESTPNNGTYTFTVPNGIGDTTEARLMIVPVDNVYLAVNPVNFTINNSLATDDLEKTAHITISPNPSKGILTIDTSKNYQSLHVEVVDMLGRNVYKYDAHTAKRLHQINLNHLSNGTYLVNIHADGEQFTKKIIIKK